MVLVLAIGGHASRRSALDQNGANVLAFLRIDRELAIIDHPVAVFGPVAELAVDPEWWIGEGLSDPLHGGSLIHRDGDILAHWIDSGQRVSIDVGRQIR